MTISSSSLVASRVCDLHAAHVSACAALVEGSSLMARYRYHGEQAAAQLRAAIAGEGDADLRVAVGGDGEVLGFAWLLPRGAFGRSAYLKLILVDPAARGRGVGAALIDDLEARHLGRAGLLLLCTADNAAARRFYEHLGYRSMGLLPGYVIPEIDEVIYYKPRP
ncbi:MAG: GNAT family N-acetyltransferase [Deltaproteobacteria bacterium]|nr:GNAT family N-acetyltransferase [Deltaproteobacteria bacterium]